MHNYPIFKHLVQFSNLVDENGKIKSTQIQAQQAMPIQMQPVSSGIVMPQPPQANQYGQRHP